MNIQPTEMHDPASAGENGAAGETLQEESAARATHGARLWRRFWQLPLLAFLLTSLLVAGFLAGQWQSTLAGSDEPLAAAATQIQDAWQAGGVGAVAEVIKEWYSAQLHLHAWSNHNAGNQPGSMQLHSQWAQTNNVDVLWWHEHNSTYHQVTDVLVSLLDATLNPDTLAVDVPLPPGTPLWAIYDFVTQLVPSATGEGEATASLADGLLRMEYQADANSAFGHFQYEARTTQGFKIGGQSFTRPLASDPVLSFDAVRCDASGADAYAEVKVDLSWHNYGSPAQQKIVYRLVPSDQPSAILSDSTVVTVTVPLTTTRVTLPLAAHASLLQDGDDNSVLGLYLTVGARNQALGCMETGNFMIHSRDPMPEQIVHKHQGVAHRHEVSYGVTQLTSWEQFAGLRHLNPYLPSTAPLLPGLTDIQVENFVPLIHSYNGLVGLNHPLGTNGGPLLPPDQQEARVQAMLNTLLPVSAWNVDLIELYKNRAQIDLLHHLRLWDLLTVNGVEVCANSASDQHGGQFWEPAFMLSWIEASAPTQDELLEGLRHCRVFFGDIRQFDGAFDLKLGPVMMGGTFPVSPGTAPLDIILDPLPANAQVKLVQYRTIPARELSYIVDHVIVDPTQPIALDVSEPSVVRAEVWRPDGTAMIFSNQIHIRAVECDVDGSGQVTTADVQSIAGLFGQTSPPVPAALDLHEDGVVDTRDIAAAGACWQVANGVLGAR